MTKQSQSKSHSAPEIKLALDLSNDAVTLNVRHDGETWKPVGDAILESPDFDDQIDALRVEALVRAKAGDSVLLWLPAEQVISRELTLAPGSEDAARAEALTLIAEETDFDSSELTVAMAPARDGKKTVVMAALLQTLDEAQAYAERWGFPKTTVSTRIGSGDFGANGPVFARPPTIAHQASLAMRRLTIAAVVMVAALGGLYGGYRALQPLLDEPVDIRSSGPAISSFAVVLDPVYSAVMPLRSVSTGSADTLAIQSVYIPDDERINTFGRGVYAGGYADFTPPEISAPADGQRMLVGSAPVLPSHDRPGRLTDAALPTAMPDTQSVRDAVDLIRMQARLGDNNTDTANGPAFKRPDKSGEQDIAALSPDTNVGTAASQRDDSSVAAPQLQAPSNGAATADDAEDSSQPTTADDDPSTAEPDADVATTAEDAPTDRAPEQMAKAPLPRPDVPAATETNATDGDPASEQPASSAAAPKTDGNQTASAPKPEPRAKEPTENAEFDENAPTQFAAVSAPAPSKRPKVFEREPVRPRATKGAVAAVSIPRTVRSAARQVGLELDKTSLIGVIDARTGRQALVRMPGGTYKKVSRGDVLDGWRVNSISREAMRLTKRGQNRTLLLVSR